MSITSDIAALQGVADQFKGSGITNFGGAVKALQAAGNAAVASIGPAIDALSGGDSGTMTITQWAWQKNGLLAATVNSDSAKQEDLTYAVSAVTDIVNWYNQANRLAASLKVAPVRAAPQVSVSLPVAARAAPVFTAPPGATPNTALAVKKATVTTPEMVASGAGGLVGLAIGARVAGIALGGPLGLVAGAAAGFMLTKAFKV